MHPLWHRKKPRCRSYWNDWTLWRNSQIVCVHAISCSSMHRFNRRHFKCISWMNSFVFWFSAKPLHETMLAYCQLDLRNKFQWNSNRNSKLFIHGHAFESVVCEKRPICRGGYKVKMTSADALMFSITGSSKCRHIEAHFFKISPLCTHFCYKLGIMGYFHALWDLRDGSTGIKVWTHGWAVCCLMTVISAMASRLFTQPFIQAQIIENIKAPRHLHLCGKFTGDQWIPRTKGQ